MKPVHAAYLGACVLLAGLLLSTSVRAAAPAGTYGGAGTHGCLITQAADGFNDSLQPNTPSASWSSSGSALNLYVFNSDGTGTVESEVVTITPPPTPGFAPSASSSAATGGLTWSSTGGHRFTVTVSGETGSILTGPRAGQTFTVDSFTLNGLVDTSGKGIALSATDPSAETITYSDGTTLQRICHRSGFLERKSS